LQVQRDFSPAAAEAVARRQSTVANTVRMGGSSLLSARAVNSSAQETPQTLCRVPLMKLDLVAPSKRVKK
jgi:hypothetical protein